MKTLTSLTVAAAAMLMIATAPLSATELSETDLENLVKRSYQYVAMYNVNNKFALQNEPASAGGRCCEMRTYCVLRHARWMQSGYIEWPRCEFVKAECWLRNSLQHWPFLT